MEDLCGKKVHKFDAIDDKSKTITLRAPWYKPRDSWFNPTDFPLYTFKKLGICNYVFIMPENAAYDSSFQFTFKGWDAEKNRNT